MAVQPRSLSSGRESRAANSAWSLPCDQRSGQCSTWNKMPRFHVEQSAPGEPAIALPAADRRPLHRANPGRCPAKVHDRPTFGHRRPDGRAAAVTSSQPFRQRPAGRPSPTRPATTPSASGSPPRLVQHRVIHPTPAGADTAGSSCHAALRHQRRPTRPSPPPAAPAPRLGRSRSAGEERGCSLFRPGADYRSISVRAGKCRASWDGCGGCDRHRRTRGEGGRGGSWKRAGRAVQGGRRGRVCSR